MFKVVLGSTSGFEDRNVFVDCTLWISATVLYPTTVQHRFKNVLQNYTGLEEQQPQPGNNSYCTSPRRS